MRERIDDIPVLTSHFINYSIIVKAGKKISGLSDKVLKNMMAYHWPGNIRELENFLRSILEIKL